MTPIILAIIMGMNTEKAINAASITGMAKDTNVAITMVTVKNRGVIILFSVKMNKSSVVVSAAILEQNGKILICRRKNGGSCGNLWEFPGGKIEPGETLEECLVRECREELGIDISVTDLFDECCYRYPEREVHLYFYRGKILRGKPHCRVHQSLAWVEPKSLTGYPFCPGDEGVIAKLSQGNF